MPIFQSTLPIREETRRSGCCRPCQGISIHSSHTGRDTSQNGSYHIGAISIHSSHTGRDAHRVTVPSAAPISIHSSHTGRDISGQSVADLPQFQSTLPIREETTFEAKEIPSLWDFNPLFPYGKRRCCLVLPSSIARTFQSTLPIREETQTPRIAGCCPAISIHSSHTGRDPLRCLATMTSPEFQSTLPIREETLPAPVVTADDEDISIHSSHTGRDLMQSSTVRVARKFQSTLPIREETECSTKSIKKKHFNPLFPYGKRLPERRK